MCRAINEAAPDRHCQIILDECEALEQELAQIQPGDFLVIFFEKLEAVRKIIERHQAITSPAIEMQAGNMQQYTQRAGEIR